MVYGIIPCIRYTNTNTPTYIYLQHTRIYLCIHLFHIIYYLYLLFLRFGFVKCSIYTIYYSILRVLTFCSRRKISFTVLAALFYHLISLEKFEKPRFSSTSFYYELFSFYIITSFLHFSGNNIFPLYSF